MPDWKPRNTIRCRDLRNRATPAERKLYKHLSARGADGHKFCRQLEIRDGDVGPYYPDFTCRKAKLIVELDGYSHDLSVEQDARRTRDLERLGYRVLRFTNAEVFGSTEGVVTMIIGARRHAHPRPLPQAGGEMRGASAA